MKGSDVCREQSISCRKQRLEADGSMVCCNMRHPLVLPCVVRDILHPDTLICFRRPAPGLKHTLVSQM